MKKYFIAVSVAILMSLPTAAIFAQDGNVQALSFEDENIDGELMAPNQSDFDVLEEEEAKSLIRVREDFVDEMIKSAEDL